MYFESLRMSPWHPEFEFKSIPWEVADQINSFHEDYPERVDKTVSAMLTAMIQLKFNPVVNQGKISNSLLCQLNKEMGFEGKFRSANVKVGFHNPPDVYFVFPYMEELECRYSNIVSIEELVEWYKDFETIHPFIDGNGRVGGVIIATYSVVILGTRLLTVRQ